MNNKISIIYRWDNVNLDNWISIEELGEQLINFSDLSKTIFKEVWKIDTKDLDLKITWLKNGSIIIDLIIDNIGDFVSCFKNVYDFLNYLHTIDIDIYNKAIEYINSSINSYKELENWGKDHPIALSISTLIIASYGNNLTNFLKKIFKISKKVKILDVESFSDDSEINIDWLPIKWKIVKNTKKIINQWKFVDFLEPIAEDKVNAIDIWLNEDFEEISNTDFENLIGDWFTVLPEYKNGEEYDFFWSFTAMQSNVGETMKLKCSNLKDKNGKYFLLSCIPSDWHTTEEYKEFYWESIIVNVEAEVFRNSVYKKPKLIIKNVNRINPSLLT